MAKEMLDKVYEPAKHEAGIYELWEKSGAFKPAAGAKKTPYSIIMPPPNANGDLHLGHAMYTVEDIMARYMRMNGHPTLWLPGADHAGIETQVVFERVLAKEDKSRFDLGREEFYKQALAFTKKNMTNMTEQLRSLGFSPDWSRFKFTLDEDIVTIVYETFKQLHEDGYIYRGNRIVNWCPHCRSGFADIEIKYREQIDPLYYIKYGPFVLATVRPETKFGDTALAVHPKDERYAKFVGKEVEAEDLLGPIKLKVIADEHVDPDFGTGVVKVTPAHDPNDWEMGLRHGLEVKQAIGTDGNLTELAGKYAGMPVDEARQQVAHDLEERGLIDHVDMNYKHSIAIHDRCGTAIEPLVTEQWWLKVEELKKPAIAAVKSGKIKIVPKRFEKQYLSWLENLRDWNISRQNWFGIKVPVFYGAQNASESKLKPYLITANEQEAIDYYGKGNYEAETDTFDTWFSSSQWPFATLMATGAFDQFYPTSLMGTMRDILYLWVARMVMMGIYKTGEVPFREVYLWGAVNDEHGKKMSKSKGNVINPLEMTGKYGTDALRLALTIGITPGTGGSISEAKIEGYRNFCNKLWNVARFTLSQVGEDYSPTLPQPKSLADKWIMGRLAQATKEVSDNIEKYRFSEAGSLVYSLLWDDFADWYVEAAKVEPNQSVLVYGFETILQLLHPFAPFITEAIWQALPWQKQNLITTGWPKVQKSASGGDFVRIMALVSQIRNIKAEAGIDKPKLLQVGEGLISDNAQLVQKLAGLASIEKISSGKGLRLTSGGVDAWLDLSIEQINQYRSKLDKQYAEGRRYQKSLEAQLANKRFVESAPAEVVAAVKDRLAQAEMVVSKLDEQLKALDKN